LDRPPTFLNVPLYKKKKTRHKHCSASIVTPTLADVELKLDDDVPPTPADVELKLYDKG